MSRSGPTRRPNIPMTAARAEDDDGEEHADTADDEEHETEDRQLAVVGRGDVLALRELRRCRGGRAAAPGSVPR